MPAEYQIDQTRRLVLSRAWGEVTAADFFAHGHRLLADPNFSPDFRQLWDLTEVTETHTDFSQLADMAKLAVFAPTSRRAIFAPIDVSFGIGRMFQMLREARGETGIRVFRDRAEALHWLETGEDPPPAPRFGSADPLKNSPRRA